MAPASARAAGGADADPALPRGEKFRRSRNRVISLALHSIALILCVLLLAGMTFRYEVPNRENQLILLVDVSDSGAEVEEARNEFIRTVLNACDESCEVGIVTFGYGTVYAAPLSADAREVYRQYRRRTSRIPVPPILRRHWNLRRRR